MDCRNDSSLASGSVVLYWECAMATCHYRGSRPTVSVGTVDVDQGQNYRSDNGRR